MAGMMNKRSDKKPAVRIKPLELEGNVPAGWNEALWAIGVDLRRSK
jgi:hypothetical protein